MSERRTLNCDAFRGLSRKRLCFWGALFLAISAAISLSSYWRSCRIQYFDASIATDEGLLWAFVPLARMTPDHKPTTDLTVYAPDPSPVTDFRFMWTSGIKHRVPMRDFIPYERMNGRNGLLVGGFGYHVQSWMGRGRPGPGVMLICPIWFPLFIIFCALAVVRWRTFSLRFLMLVTTFSALIVWLLTLLTSRTGGAE